jgi:hypothetical protein
MDDLNCIAIATAIAQLCLNRDVRAVLFIARGNRACRPGKKDRASSAVVVAIGHALT